MAWVMIMLQQYFIVDFISVCFWFILFYIFSGWINGLSVIGSHTGAGVTMLIVALFFTIHAILKIILLIRVCLICMQLNLSLLLQQACTKNDHTLIYQSSAIKILKTLNTENKEDVYIGSHIAFLLNIDRYTLLYTDIHLIFCTHLVYVYTCIYSVIYLYILLLKCM